VLLKTKGEISIESVIKPGMIEIVFGNVSIFNKTRSKTIWDVSGKVIFKGTACIGHGSKLSVNTEGVLRLGNNFEISAESSCDNL
jgi:hypothetical protein